MSTFSPGISTVFAMYSFLKPKTPLLSFVFVSSVRITVTLPLDLLTINVSPVREAIIPLTWVFSPSAPNVDTVASRQIAAELNRSVIRFLCMASSSSPVKF
jgi:hypothetical protein